MSLSTTKQVRELVNKHQLNSSQNIGSYSKLYREHKAATWQEFQCVIHQHGQKKLSEVLLQVKELQSLEGLNLSDQEIREALVQFLVKDTFAGLNKEVKAKQELQSVFPQLDFTESQDLDHRYAVDIAVRNGEEMLLGIQVKPRSYFTQNPGAALLKDRETNQEKNKQFQTVYGAQVFYLEYDTNQDAFVNLVACEAQIRQALANVVLTEKLLSRKTGIDFMKFQDLSEEETLWMYHYFQKRVEEYRP